MKKLVKEQKKILQVNKEELLYLILVGISVGILILLSSTFADFSHLY
jgi:hypothetical protein